MFSWVAISSTFLHVQIPLPMQTFIYMENRHTGFYVVTSTPLFWCPEKLASHSVIKLLNLHLDRKTLPFSCPACFPTGQPMHLSGPLPALAKPVFPISFPLHLYFILITAGDNTQIPLSSPWSNEMRFPLKGASIALAAVLQLLLYWIQRITWSFATGFVTETQNWSEHGDSGVHVQGPNPVNVNGPCSVTGIPTLFSPALGSLSEVHPTRRALWGGCSWLCPRADGRRSDSWAAWLH